jgi:excisionase family DNA binding protein
MKKLRSIKELADYLGCSPTTAQNLKKSGKIPYIQFGRKLIFDTELIEKALLTHTKS